VAEARLALADQRRHPADPDSPASRLVLLRARVVAADLHDAVAADLSRRLDDAERGLDHALEHGEPLDPVHAALDGIARDLDAAE
jgi:hypothetical protein